MALKGAVVALGGKRNPQDRATLPCAPIETICCLLNLKRYY